MSKFKKTELLEMAMEHCEAPKSANRKTKDDLIELIENYLDENPTTTWNIWTNCMLNVFYPVIFASTLFLPYLLNLLSKKLLESDYFFKEFSCNPTDLKIEKMVGYWDIYYFDVWSSGIYDFNN